MLKKKTPASSGHDCAPYMYKNAPNLLQLSQAAVYDGIPMHLSAKV